MTRAKATAAARFPIRAVAKLTGLSIDTLRAWERRHHAVTPIRGDRGRLYTERDVERLRLLREAVARGHAIGHAVRLSDRDLRSITGTSAPPALATASPTDALDRGDILAALERFDGPAVEAALARLAALLDARTLWRQFLSPLLADIGQRWEHGQANVAHEHLLSASVRNVLGTLMRAHVRQEAATHMVFATPPGERHELGTLAAAMMAAAGGLRAVYLGPDIPASDLLELAQTIEPDVLVLGVTGSDGDVRLDDTIESLAKGLPRDVELWIGGAGAEAAAGRAGARVLGVPDFEAFEAQLGRIGAQF